MLRLDLWSDVWRWTRSLRMALHLRLGAYAKSSSAETESRRRRGREMDLPRTASRGDAAAARWIYRGLLLAATPRPRDGSSADPASRRRRGVAAARATEKTRSTSSMVCCGGVLLESITRPGPAPLGRRARAWTSRSRRPPSCTRRRPRTRPRLRGAGARRVAGAPRRLGGGAARRATTPTLFRKDPSSLRNGPKRPPRRRRGASARRRGVSLIPRRARASDRPPETRRRTELADHLVVADDGLGRLEGLLDELSVDGRQVLLARPRRKERRRLPARARAHGAERRRRGGLCGRLRAGGGARRGCDGVLRARGEPGSRFRAAPPLLPPGALADAPEAIRLP